MFKLPNLPSAQPGIHEMADFAELWAWDEGSVSEPKMLAALGLEDENEVITGCEDSSDIVAEGLDEVMIELGRRSEACGNGYPFVLDSPGITLRHAPDEDNHRSEVYRYLLLSTRLNMKDNKIHAGIDGTGLLEELGAHALRCYLGQSRALSMVFGTSAQGGFVEKVNSLCRSVGEGGSFKNNYELPLDSNDERLDAVAWVPFSDKLRGQLVVFGQCKTGTTWEGQVTDLQPEGFIKKWMSVSYLLDPLRAYCISEVAEVKRREGVIVYSGLLLDRCRIVDFCDNLDTDLVTRIKKWSKAAMASTVIPKKRKKVKAIRNKKTAKK